MSNGFSKRAVFDSYHERDHRRDTYERRDDAYERRNDNYSDMEKRYRRDEASRYTDDYRPRYEESRDNRYSSRRYEDRRFERDSRPVRTHYRSNEREPKNDRIERGSYKESESSFQLKRAPSYSSEKTQRNSKISNSRETPETKAKHLSPEQLVILTIPVKDINDFEKLSQIGEGTYGKVYKARWISQDRLVALKKIRMETEKEGFPVTATREIKILRSLNHPNIVSLLDMITSKESVYLVFEYLEYDMAALLSHPSFILDIASIKFLLLQLIRGVDYLHSKNIVHRDIKGSNILLDHKGTLKLADFGLARSLGRYPLKHMTNRVITLWYRPPELLLGSSQYGKQVDMWGIGCIFAEWLKGSPLFQGTNEISQLESIYKILGIPDLESEDFPELSKCPWASLVRIKDSVDVQSSLDSLSSLFPELSNAGQDLLSGLFELEPSKRITSSKAMNHPFFSEDPQPSSISQYPIEEQDWHEYQYKLVRKKKSVLTPSTLTGVNPTPFTFSPKEDP